jgi:excisionase family DNA binding protein
MSSLLTARELAEDFGVAPATIYSRAKQRLIPCYRMGDRLLFDRDEVLAAIRQPATESGDFGIRKMIPIASGGR